MSPFKTLFIAVMVAVLGSPLMADAHVDEGAPLDAESGDRGVEPQGVGSEGIDPEIADTDDVAAPEAGMAPEPTTAAQPATDLHVILCGEVFAGDRDVIAAFDAARDNVTVMLEEVPWRDCQDRSLALAAAGEPPSLAYMGSRMLRQLAARDLIVPVPLAEDQRAAYQPGVLRTVAFDGAYWGLPHALSTKALYLNCDIIEAAGADCAAPATWAEMRALAQQVVDNTSAAGIGLAAKEFDNTMHQFLNYLYANGGQVIDAEGALAFDSVETREALAFYAALVPRAQDGVVEWERDALVDLFNDGRIAMYINGPFAWERHDAGIAQRVVPIPHGPSGESGTLLITDSIVVFKGTGHEALATELARALTSGQAQYDIDLAWGLTPMLRYDDLGIEDLYYEAEPDRWGAFVSGMDAGGPEPLVTDFALMQSVIVEMVQGAILEEDSIDALVTTAAEALRAAL